MCQKYLTLLEAYIHDRDNTAINIESPTIEIASPQRGEKRSYQDANSASPQTGERRPYQAAYVASPQHGLKRTYQDADLASPVGLQTTTSSMGARCPRVGEKLHDAVFTNLAALGQGLQVHYDVRGVVRICMPSPVNIESRGQNC